MTNEAAQAKPTPLQDPLELARRRRMVAVMNLTVYLLLLVWLGAILQQDGWSDIDLAIFIAFAIAAPWSVLGFCNAMLGFWLLHMRPDAPGQGRALRATTATPPRRSRSASPC